MPAVAPRNSCVLERWPLVTKSLFLLLVIHDCNTLPASLVFLSA